MVGGFQLVVSRERAGGGAVLNFSKREVGN